MIATQTGLPQIVMKRLFYPKWWLQVGAEVMCVVWYVCCVCVVYRVFVLCCVVYED